MNAAPAIGFELGLSLAGLSLIWRYILGPAARARRRPAVLQKWDISGSDFILYLVFAICGGIFLQIIVARLLFRPAMNDVTRLIVANAGLHLGVLAGIAGFHFGFARQDASVPAAPFGTLLAGAATFLISLPVLVCIGIAWQGLLTSCGVPMKRQSVIDLFLDAHSLTLRVTLTVFAVVIAPMTEELIFRRGLFRYLRGRVPRWLALTGPALLFGAAHANLASFAPLVALGLIFSLAYERTGRIGTSMVAHGLFNLNMVVLIFAGVNV